MASEKVCERCGTKLNEQVKFCPECGNRVSDGINDGFKTLPPCPNCGHPMTVDLQNLSVIKCPACGLTQVDIFRQEKQLKEKQAREDKEKARRVSKQEERNLGIGCSLGLGILMLAMSIVSGDSETLVIGSVMGGLGILVGICLIIASIRVHH